MGLLDQVVGAVTAGMGQAGSQSGGNANLLNLVIGMLGNDSQSGGLAGLAKQFQQGGLGDVMQSWIGKGENMPISADQLSRVFGSATLSKMGQQLGMDGGDLSDQLSQMLPGLVDKLTPNGQIPEGGLGSVADLLGGLDGLLGKR